MFKKTVSKKKKKEKKARKKCCDPFAIHSIWKTDDLQKVTKSLVQKGNKLKLKLSVGVQSVEKKLQKDHYQHQKQFTNQVHFPKQVKAKAEK